MAKRKTTICPRCDEEMETEKLSSCTTLCECPSCGFTVQTCRGHERIVFNEGVYDQNYFNWMEAV